MKTIGPPSTQVRKLNAVASGTLPNGAATVVNADGTVSAIEGTTVTQALGTVSLLSPEQVEEGKMTSIYDPYSNTVVNFYSVPSGLYARVCTVSGSTVTPGTVTQIHATSSGGTVFVGAITATLTAASAGAGFPQYIFIAFTEANSAGGNSVTKARMAYVSGGTTLIAVGSVSLLNSQNQGQYNLNLTSAYDPVVDRVVVAFKDNANRGKAFLVTIINNNTFSGGTLISLGTGLSQTNIDLTYETASGKVISSFTNGNTYGVVQPLTAGLTTLTAGTITVFSSVATNRIKAVEHTEQKEIVFIYSTVNAGVGQDTCIVGTFQAGGGFSFNTPAVFTTNAGAFHLEYHSASEKVGITCRDNVNVSTFYIATINSANRALSFTGPDTFESGLVGATNIVNDPTAEELVLIYSGSNIRPITGGVAVLARTLQVAYTSTTLTAENYIGISKGGYPDADVATIDVQGAIHTVVDLDTITSFAVTVANPGPGNRYYIDGTLQATIALSEGKTYRLDQSDASNSGHPLRFSITSNGTHAGGVEYTTGVTVVGTPGSSGAYTQIVVAIGAPTLYYYCSIHSLMGGQATTADDARLAVGQSYFVRTDGTLNTAAGVPEVFAGTAISTTKLIVKG